jgi:hypothetical protein
LSDSSNNKGQRPRNWWKKEKACPTFRVNSLKELWA